MHQSEARKEKSEKFESFLAEYGVEKSDPINEDVFGETIPFEDDEKKKTLAEAAKKKIKDAYKKRESVRLQLNEAEQHGTSPQLSGYITIQGGGSFFWKRRWTGI